MLSLITNTLKVVVVHATMLRAFLQELSRLKIQPCVHREDDHTVGFVSQRASVLNWNVNGREFTSRSLKLGTN